MNGNARKVVALAQAEVARMRSAIANTDENSEVRMRISQFVKLTDLMQALVESVDSWSDDSMDDTRYWVPLDHFQRVKTEAERWSKELSQLKVRSDFNDLLRI